MAEFTKDQDIADEPAFAWWVTYTMQKRNVILSTIKSRIHKTTNKYGIKIPTSTEHGHRLENENGNNCCRNIPGHAFMDRPAARLETMALVIRSYVLVYVVGKRR